MHGIEHGERPSAPGSRAANADARQMLVELPADGQHGIERRERLLRNERDLAAEQGAPRCPPACAPGPAPSNIKLALGDGEAARQKLSDGAPDHRLAGAGFADQAEHAPAFEREAQTAE